MNEYILSAENISKAFVGVQALDDVSVRIKKGEIRCLAGENGSGKSTFVKTVSGIYHQDAGNIILSGKSYAKLTPKQAMSEGVQVIYQDLSLFSHMSVAENIALTKLRQDGKRFTDWKEMYKIANTQLARIGVCMDLNATVMETSIANRQLTAICRALAQDAKILFMDEPTTALTQQEVGRLLNVVQELKQAGLAIVFISHKLDEVFEISDTITIFRDGKKIGDFESADMNEQKLAYHMTGRDVKYPRYTRLTQDSAPLLQVNRLTKKGNYSDISFDVRKGDIVGITGLLGSGRTELALSLFGLNPPDSGDIRFDGKRLKPESPQVAMKAGIALLPEDRSTQGIFSDRSIKENISSAVLDTLSAAWGRLDGKKEQAMAEQSIRELRVRTPNAQTHIGTLSGGNQQKAVVAKWANTAPKLFIMDSPTVGIDIGSKAEIYELIQSFAANGMSVILISDEIEELLANCNRMMIMNHGQCVAQLEENELAGEDIAHKLAALISKDMTKNNTTASTNTAQKEDDHDPKKS